LKVSKELAKLVLAWIVNEAGFHKKVPNLVYSKRKSEIYGKYEWETETITIYEKPHLTIPLWEFIDTVIHEFAHHKQNKSKVFYKRLNKSVGGFHPELTSEDLELEAELFAKKHTNKFLKIINQK
jgi:hypothetical protein